MSSEKRPQVTVEKVVSAKTGDITHCLVKVGARSIIAPLTESSDALCERVADETDVNLTVSELKMVTIASRVQMGVEADRLQAVLETMPAHTVADVGEDMLFWLDTEGSLVWVEGISLNGESPSDVLTADISEVGDIDTEELNNVSMMIRAWVANPDPLQADPEWILAVEDAHKARASNSQRMGA